MQRWRRGSGFSALGLGFGVYSNRYGNSNSSSSNNGSNSNNINNSNNSIHSSNRV